MDNGDGTYTICTKVTEDTSALGVTSGSKETGANVVEWEANGSDDQKWTLETYIPPMNGTLVRNLQVSADAFPKAWSISDSAKTGSPVFGDRDVTYTQLPEILNGAENIVTACDAKNCTSDLASFTVSADADVYVLLDTRVENLPAWMSGYTKINLTAANDKDVTFAVYKQSVKAGETVTLGTNGQSAYCVNYTVFVTDSGNSVRGDVNADGSCDTLDVVLLQKWILNVPGTTLPNPDAADLNGDGQIDIFDLGLMKHILTEK